MCLIDPVGDVYACPFAIHDAFLAGNVRDAGRLRPRVARVASCSASLREPQSGGACEPCSAYDACRGGCMAAKFFTGLPLDGPDPECVKGHGEAALVAVVPGAGAPTRRSTTRKPASRSGAGRRPTGAAPDRACDENPLAGARHC